LGVCVLTSHIHKHARAHIELRILNTTDSAVQNLLKSNI